MRTADETARAYRFSRGLLWLNVLLFGCYGIAYLVAPSFFSVQLTGVAPQNAAAAIDARAIYGGLTLGLTSFLVIAVRGDGNVQKAGQLGCSLTYGTIAAGRLVGMLVAGSSTALMIVLAAGEVVFALLSAYAYRRLP
jgi:hypothetical protein